MLIINMKLRLFGGVKDTQMLCQKIKLNGAEEPEESKEEDVIAEVPAPTDN